MRDACKCTNITLCKMLTPCLAPLTCVADNSRHFHAIPPRTLPHHVPVEGVQDTLVRELQRVVKHALPRKTLYLDRVSFLDRLRVLLTRLRVDYSRMSLYCTITS